MGIPRTTINFILKNGIGASNYDMVNKILKALDIHAVGENALLLDSQSINLLNIFSLLDDIGKHTVESVAQTEYRRIQEKDSTDALIAAYGSISTSKPMSDEEKAGLKLIQKIKEKNTKDE